MIDNFIQTFTNLLSQGITRLTTPAIIIASLLASIDFLFSFIYESVNDYHQIFKKVFNKIINYAFVFALLKGYKKALDGITLAIFEIGYKFFPKGGGRVGQFPSFDSIYDNLRISIFELEKERKSLPWTEFGLQLFYIFIILIGFFMIFLIIKEIIVSFIEFKVVATIGMLLVPFLALEQTKSFGSKLWNAILNSLSKLLISLVLTGIVLQMLEQIRFVAGKGKVDLGIATSYIFMLALSAYLITNAKELGSMLSNGTMGGRVGSGIVSAATGMVLGAAAAIATGGAALTGAAMKGLQAYKAGKNIRGVLNSMKEGAAQGKDILKSTRLGKMGSRLSKGLQNTVDYATGNRSFSNILNDVYEGSIGTIGEQIMHDKEDVAEKIANLKSGSIGKISDFINNDYSISNSAKEAFKEFKKSSEDLKFSERFKNAYNKYKENREFGKTKEAKENMYDKAKEKYHENKKNKSKSYSEYMKKRFTK